LLLEMVLHAEIFIPLEGLSDIDVERKRLTKEITRLEKQIQNITAKLMNIDFIARAPKDVIEREKQKVTDFQASLNKLQANLHSLED
jgi:valyl-tRNA synthetase